MTHTFCCCVLLFRIFISITFSSAILVTCPVVSADLRGLVTELVIPLTSTFDVVVSCLLLAKQCVSVCVCVFLISLLSELQKLVCFHGVVSCSSTFVSVGFLVHYLQICDKKTLPAYQHCADFFVTELSSLTCAKYENVNTLQNRKTLTRCRTNHLTRTQNIFYIAVLNVGVFLSGHTSKPQYALPGFPFFFFFWPARGPES